MAGGRESRLLDDVLGSGFALVALGSEAACALAELAGGVVASLEMRRMALYFGEAGGELDGLDWACVVGEDFGLREQPGAILLVRPDRFVAGQWSVGEVSEIKRDIFDLCAHGEGDFS